MRNISQGNTAGRTTETIIGVLPGDGWVVDRLDSNNVRSVMPLAGWAAMAPSGELRPLPFSLGADWTVRPRTEADEHVIAATSARMRPQANNDWSSIQ